MRETPLLTYGSSLLTFSNCTEGHTKQTRRSQTMSLPHFLAIRRNAALKSGISPSQLPAESHAVWISEALSNGSKSVDSSRWLRARQRGTDLLIKSISTATAFLHLCLRRCVCSLFCSQDAAGCGRRSPAGPVPTSARWSPSPVPIFSSSYPGTLRPVSVPKRLFFCLSFRSRKEMKGQQR